MDGKYRVQNIVWYLKCRSKNIKVVEYRTQIIEGPKYQNQNIEKTIWKWQNIERQNVEQAKY